jgi:1-phosphofructokinase
VHLPPAAPPRHDRPSATGQTGEAPTVSPHRIHSPPLLEAAGRSKGGTPMIVTLTPNPSVDRTVEVAELIRGAVLRAVSARVDPGGKGVNVARALAANGRKASAVIPSGGAEGMQLTSLLEPEGIGVVGVAIAGAVRANISVTEPDGTVTKLNEPGPRLSEREVAELISATVNAARAGAEWVVCSGSLPLGVPDTFYAELVPALRETKARVVIDSSGAALAAAIPAHPDVIKPNREELAEAAGQEIHTVGDVVAAAGVLRSRGAGTVLASLGADGAVLVEDSGAYFGEAPIDTPRGAVGAGDAMLAGFLAGGGAGPQALAEGLAWGAAAASLPGSRMPTPADLNRSTVVIHPHLQQDRILRERS